MNHTYGLNEKSKVAAIAAQNELCKHYRKIINPVREALRGARYLFSGGLDKKHSVALDAVLEYSNGKIRSYVRRSFGSIYLSIDTNYRVGESSCEYIKHDVYLGSVDDANLITLEDGEHAQYKTTAANREYTLAGYDKAIALIRSYESKIRELENKIVEQRRKIRPFIS